MRQQHPASTLFPYTTLFRSHEPQHARPAAIVGRQPVVASRLPLGRHRAVDRQEPRMGRVGAEGTDTSGAGNPDGSQDRKSTRLNSSHTVISYAVFCLKKKTK